MGKNSAFSITRRNVSPNQKRHHYLQMQMSLSKTNYALHKRSPQDRNHSCKMERRPLPSPLFFGAGDAGPASSALLPAAPHLTTAHTGDFSNEKRKKQSRLLCTTGLTQLENDLHVLKVSSLIYSRVFMEPCFTKQLSLLMSQRSTGRLSQKEDSWSPL